MLIVVAGLAILVGGGLWVRRARAQWYSVKAELERELAAEELKRTLQDTRQTMSDLDAPTVTAFLDHLEKGRGTCCSRGWTSP